MATRIHRTTLFLDSQTVETIKKLSAFWDVPEAEVVRRSIAQSAMDHLADRKIVIQQLQEYWTKNSRTDNSNSQQLEDYTLEVVEDRNNWRA